jgi:hypothetical protein
MTPPYVATSARTPELSEARHVVVFLTPRCDPSPLSMENLRLHMSSLREFHPMAAVTTI